MKKIIISNTEAAAMCIPCRSCGRQPEMMYRIRVKSYRAALICSCGRSTGFCLSEEKAVDAWNKGNEE